MRKGTRLYSQVFLIWEEMFDLFRGEVLINSAFGDPLVSYLDCCRHARVFCAAAAL